MFHRAVAAIAVVCLVVVAAGCSGAPLIRPSLKDAPTHERYSRALEEFGLHNVALGRDWLAAATRALSEPRPATLPFEETGYLAGDKPTAVAYRLELRRGRTLAVDVRFESAEPSRFFVDLFEDADDDEPRRVGGLEPGQTSFQFNVRRDGVYLLRLQPELLRGGRYTVTQRTLASLASPVAGFVVTQVSSGFGAPRDGGARDHHGIDIFRPRGTPVLASADGHVRLDETPRGGRVIWLRDANVSRSVYYAHLNDWAVEHGTFVRTGEVIGYVGNTGNASSTPPHLHFGVYERGPGDPVPYLVRDDAVPKPPTASSAALGSWVRVIRPTPLVATGVPVPALMRGQVMRAIAATGAQYRVELPDGRVGLVRAADVTGASAAPLASRTHAGPVLETPRLDAVVVTTLERPRALPVFGYTDEFAMVGLPNEQLGWIARQTSAGSR